MSFETITLKGNIAVTTDFSNTSRCRGCGKVITWAVTKSAKYMPIIKDKDGAWMSHFADCKEATRFKREARYEEDRQKKREEWLYEAPKKSSLA
jgi:hypothetical protein